MALVPRIRLKGDLEHPALAPLLADLMRFVERVTGGPVGYEAICPDVRDAEALRDLMRAHGRRATLPFPVTLHWHTCPHVPGMEETSWGACNTVPYGYQEESL